MENDQEIKQFFKEWKAKDENLHIPEFEGFPKPKSNSTPLWVSIGIAASLLLFAPLIWPEQDLIEAPSEVVIISLEENENHEQQFSIQQSTYLDTWESPTSSLLTEY